MKAPKKLSERENFVGGLYAIGLAMVCYLGDCAIAPEKVNNLFWLARGVYALGPFGFIATVVFFVIGLSVMTYSGIKLLFRKGPIQPPVPTRGNGP